MKVWSVVKNYQGCFDGLEVFASKDGALRYQASLNVMQQALDFDSIIKETTVEIEKPKKLITTLMSCSFKGCSGCLNGYYDEVEKLWIFTCNKCGKEAGKGIMEVEKPKGAH